MGYRGRATFARQDLWKTDFSPYQRVVIFGVEEMVSSKINVDPTHHLESSRI